MTDHVFTGLIETAFPFAKDAHGINIGLAEPGEIRDTAGPIDHQWREATDEDRDRWEAIQAQRADREPEPAAEPEPGTSGDDSPADEGDAGEPDGSPPQEHDDGPAQPADPDA